MQIGAVWNAKVINLNYTLNGHTLALDDSTLYCDVTADKLAFAIYDAVLTSSADDSMPKVGDLITVKLTTEAIVGRKYEVGTVNLRLTDAVITDIDKGGNLYVEAKLTAATPHDVLL